ncbi:hypothetical protein NLX83_40260 [Allokutzneria sp. A3M-2-11 16]|uniref:hypothetical protein n=1 Tax=Allokutzneria sp. A3M-2-11 16 TaxID=2962043 RepID=UPI0020B7CFB4|nr:hypothetical protein [Allokutzneria sp. A3M-2-11 16]MCP3805518.1 hypothetical protein [Allokutzneria sp. A3M-2-11 16]
MRRAIVFLSGATAALAVVASGCSGSITGTPAPAPEPDVKPTTAPVSTAPTTSALPPNGLADPDGRFYTATVPAGLVNATKLVSWSGSNHAVLTPDGNPQDNQNYITISTDALHKGDAGTIENELRNPKIVIKDPPPTRYSRQPVDGRESVVQSIGPAKAPRDPNVTVSQRVYYIPNKDAQGRPVVVRCRWTDTNKDLAKAIDTGCAALVGQIKLK